MMAAGCRPLGHLLDVAVEELPLAPCTTPAARVVLGLPEGSSLLHTLFLEGVPVQAVNGILTNGPSTMDCT